ncbi:sensor histidine kinase [Marinomonas mediterranea]|uniref:sensor histidine kinase n=1 Tax=Marinomonas mediterranea TaxID=119864 RepID=UPI00234A94D4|nr:HAMP domain-containing sensor histidine kinase [Marinomonas mediterranea]WCN13329.1 sensor histidine kinase [Marinomonas mediterranea]
MKKIDISTILASAIHESKNQVGTLLYQLQSIKDVVSSDSGKQQVEKLEEGLKQLNDEWVEYLYLYKLASEGYELHCDFYSLDEFLDDQVFALTQSANAKKLELSYSTDDDLVAAFDERLLTAVVSTGVYNALRFAQSKIQISAQLSNGFLEIAIEDDGKGFDHKDLQEDELLFEANTGLGLYFAELSAKAHVKSEKEGYIEKGSSTYLGGAKLSIFLPQ